MGIFSWFGYSLPLAERLALIRQSGFAATSLWWEDELTFADGDPASAIAQVRDAGLLLENIHVPYDGCNALWSADDMQRQAIVDRHIAWLQDCARFAIPVMVMHISQGHELKAVNEHGVASVRRIAEVAADLGVVAAIENTRKPEFIAHLLDEITSPQLGMCYDSGHNWLYGEPKAALLVDYGHRLAATHFADNDGVEDLHWLPRDGSVDWAKVAGAFPRQTYTGTIALEVTVQDKELSPEEFLRLAFERAQWLQQLFAQRETGE